MAQGDEVDLEKWPTMIDPVYKSKAQYKNLLEAHVEQLSAQQQLLYASNRHAILLIFQAMAGKDGAIRHVMSGVNPQGCQVFSFKHPSPRRTAARFPLAHYPRPARTRQDRHLQSLLTAEAPVLSQRAGAQSPAIDLRSRPRQGPRHRQDLGLRRLAPRAKTGRDAVRPPQTHPQARPATPPRFQRRPRRVPPRRHRPEPEKAGQADPRSGADLGHLSLRGAPRPP